jgi:hypothetical protein
LVPGLGAVLGPIAVILGFFSLRYLKAHPTVPGKGHAVAGLVMGLIAVAFNGIVILFIVAAVMAANGY